MQISLSLAQVLFLPYAMCWKITKTAHQADADDEDAAKAILRGLKDRYEKTGKVPSLIHTVSIYS